MWLILRRQLVVAYYKIMYLNLLQRQVKANMNTFSQKICPSKLNKIVKQENLPLFVRERILV